MSSIPEGVQTVTCEGNDVRAAVAAAAESLGVPATQVGYKLDLSHFRNATGGSVSRNTVKVVAWAKAEDEAPAPKPEKKKARKPKKDDAPKAEAAPEAAPSDDTDGEASELGQTEAAAFAEAWVKTLVGHMGLTGTVKAEGNDERVRLFVDVDKAGRLIGRRGATLSAVRHLLKIALSKWGDFVIDVDIPDERGEKKERKPREDRGGRRGDSRGRGRDRGDRGGRRGGSKGEYPEAKLEALGKRAAEKAIDTGKPVTISLVLNSHDRRIVHMAVSEVDGADSESIEKDGKKYIQVKPDLLLEE